MVVPKKGPQTLKTRMVSQEGIRVHHVRSCNDHDDVELSELAINLLGCAQKRSLPICTLAFDGRTRPNQPAAGARLKPCRRRAEALPKRLQSGSEAVPKPFCTHSHTHASLSTLACVGATTVRSPPCPPLWPQPHSPSAPARDHGITTSPCARAERHVAPRLPPPLLSPRPRSRQPCRRPRPRWRRARRGARR